MGKQEASENATQKTRKEEALSRKKQTAGLVQEATSGGGLRIHSKSTSCPSATKNESRQHSSPAFEEMNSHGN